MTTSMGLFFCTVLIHSLTWAGPTGSEIIKFPDFCPGRLCDIDVAGPRIAKVEVGLGFGAKSYYEIPNFSYLTHSVDVAFTLPDQGHIRFDEMAHGMNPSKYVTLTLKGAERLNAKEMIVRSPDGSRVWTTSCEAQPADRCTLRIELEWLSAETSGEFNLRHVSIPARYQIKAYYNSGAPLRTFTFWTTSP